MRVFISGLYSGPNPSPGIGIARSLRLAYPEATLVGVDYSNRSSGLHWTDLDDVWLQRPWSELDLEEYARQISRQLGAGALWISGLDLETVWLANVLGKHRNLLIPSSHSLKMTAKPTITAHVGLPVLIPPFVPIHQSDWELDAFCRKHDWKIWIKGPYYEARAISRWEDLVTARAELGGTWGTERLFLQAHIAGYEESIALCATNGTLLDCIHMSKREITPEGKTWAGHVTECPNAFGSRLVRTIREVNWTGGAELEMVRDMAEDLWLIEWNPRFPAWIYGGTMAGINLPGLLVESATGAPAKRAVAEAKQFVRVVTEIPARGGFPLSPAAEPGRGLGPATKHPSGMPTLARRLKEEWELADRSSTRGPRGATVPATFREDLASVTPSEIETPCWLFLDRTAETTFRDVAEAVGSLTADGARIAAAYSVKTNPDDRLIRLALDHGFLAEVISQLEIDKALSLGFTSDQLVVNGPGKWWPRGRPGHRPFGALFCDSIQEFREEIDHTVNFKGNARIIGLRLRPSHLYSRFGVPIETPELLDQISRLVRGLPVDALFGIHFHIASSAIGVSRWWHLLESMLEWSRALEGASGRRVGCIDVGGGWSPDDLISDLKPRLAALLSKAREVLPQISMVILEPGKAMAQSSMALAVRVLEIRHLSSGIEVVVDGSIAELPEIHRYPHRVLALDERTSEWQPLHGGKDRLLGRLCMEADVLAGNVELPASVQIGSVLAICDAGAYDRSMCFEFGRGKVL